MIPLEQADILAWLREEDKTRLHQLWREADRVRREHVGDEIHLRGLLEISNHCGRRCGYCGLRADNKELERYRMTADEIVACARRARQYGYGTVVMQSGEDYGIKAAWMAAVIRAIKEATGLAATLSFGERSEAELAQWRAAGADRYLLRFETSDPELYKLIHPPREGAISDRISILGTLRRLGYETGSGVMVGIPGQTYASLAADIERFRELDLDMIGIGPYIAHPATPLACGQWRRDITPEEQVPNTEAMTLKTIALARLACPEANIPSTTALATIDKTGGHELGLRCGANVVMPNVTPPVYRALYTIYPKAQADDTSDSSREKFAADIKALGRRIGAGPGNRRRRPPPISGPLKI